MAAADDIKIRMIAALAPALVLAAAPAQDAPATPHLYAVVFEVSCGEDGRVDALKISKVIDPSSGSTEPVRLDIPESFTDAAKAQLLHRIYPKSPPKFYTYLFYDPAHPQDANIDPMKPKGGS